MKTLDWINNVIVANGLLCEDYAERVRSAKSKKRLFEICNDANGVSFMPQMRAKGHPLEYEVILEDFGRYLNGKYKPEFTAPITGGTYTSATYCQYNEEKDIVIDTTVASFLACDNEVWVQPLHVAKICVDQNCHLKIYCPQNSSLVVYYWCDDANIEVVEGKDRVSLRKK